MSESGTGASLETPRYDGAAPQPSETVQQAATGPAEGWRPTLTWLAIAFVALFATFWGTASQMVETWYVSATFNHGFLILPIIGWLLWERRPALEKYVPKPTLYGLLPLTACVAAWTVANAAGINVGREFALVGMIQSIVFTFLGWRLVRAMLFPLVFLFFAVPFGDFMIPTLQDITAAMVVEGLRWIDIPVYLDGIFLTIPSGKFEVAEACSGIRFLIATLALGCLFANMSFVSVSRRVIIVLLAILVPIVANGIRAFGIVYIAHITDHTVAVGVDHIVYGWIFFAFVTVVLLGIGMTFRETDGDNTPYLPREIDQQPGPRSGVRGAMMAAVACVAISVTGPAYAALMLDRGVSDSRPVFAATGSVSGWEKSAKVTTDWRPTYVGADVAEMTTYRLGAAEVQYYVAYYTHQRDGAELINSSNGLVQEGIWDRAASGATTANVGGRDIKVKTTRLIGRGKGRVVWQWYWVGGRYTSDRYVAKFYEAASRLFGTSRAAAVIVVAADYEDDPTEATATLQGFVTHLGGLSRSLAQIAQN